MKQILLLIVLCGLLAAGVNAQTGAIVSYQLDVFDIAVDQAGVGKPLWTATVPRDMVLCNQAPLPAPTRLVARNPTIVAWVDAANAGKICKVSTVILGTLPPNTPGDYVLTVTLTDDRGWVAPRSMVSGPWNNAPPVGVTGVQVR